jgi:hypothetical protein
LGSPKVSCREESPTSSPFKVLSRVADQVPNLSRPIHANMITGKILLLPLNGRAGASVWVRNKKIPELY